MLSVTLALLVNLAPEPAPTTAELTTQLDAQIDVVLETPDAAKIAALDRLIGEFEDRPLDIMADIQLADQLLLARVVVAWAQRQPERAAAAMDEAIRSSAGRELPLSGLGTDLKNLAKQRAAVLESAGTASIEVACLVPCQVLVNERRSVNPTDPLLLGNYRVWVVSTDTEIEPLRADVELDVAGETERIEFGRVGPIPPPPGLVESSKRKQDGRMGPTEMNEWQRRQPDAPLLPLWVEIGAIVAGAGLLATGAGLLAIDGQCKGGGDPATCPTLIENTAQGAALSALGSATILSFASVLGVDRAQIGKRIRAGASVGLGFRF